jgi:hypothetical protein
MDLPLGSVMNSSAVVVAPLEAARGFGGCGFGACVVGLGVVGDGGCGLGGGVTWSKVNNRNATIDP